MVKARTCDQSFFLSIKRKKDPPDAGYDSYFCHLLFQFHTTSYKACHLSNFEMYDKIKCSINFQLKKVTMDSEIGPKIYTRQQQISHNSNYFMGKK